MKLEFTQRGFARIDFNDDGNEPCSLQKSSSGSRIWLGRDNIKIEIIRSDLRDIKNEFESRVSDLLNGSNDSLGWAELILPKEFLLAGRMHLNQDQVKELLPFLIRFAITGQIHNVDDDPYLREYMFYEERKYNPNYGNERECVCGHTYSRHFDTYDDMHYVGCKHCGCSNFKEKAKSEDNGVEE